MSHDKLPQLESLELRRLFVAGTAGNDVIEILAVNAGDPFSYRVVVNGVTAVQETAPDETFIIDVDALAGDDLLTTDSNLLITVRARGGDGNDTLVGGSRPDTLVGEAGDDLLFGKAHSDSLVGGAGNDTLRGGDGADSLTGDANNAVGDFSTPDGDDFLFGENGDDSASGGGGSDTLNGGAGNDSLRGDAGNDFAFGGDGDDSIQFAVEILGDLSSHNDTLDGAAGNDELLVFSSHDAAYVTLDGIANDGRRGDATNVLPTFESFLSIGLAPGSVIDFSQASGGVTMRYEDAVTEVRPLWVTYIGSPFADRFEMVTENVRTQVDGRGGDDTIFGGGQDDTLVGSGGRDHIAAGLGNDVVFGDHDDGTADYGSDTIEGNAGNDVLIGGGNNDVILGEGGRDTLIGGGGNDRMFGGPDAADKIIGGTGTDSAATDDKDIYESVEVMLV